MSDTKKTPVPDGQVFDAVSGNWVDRLAPARSRPYLRLSRADRPIGTWLLLLPTWWGALLAAAFQGAFGLAELWVLAGSAIGAWLMRGAGCTWNDITDRKFDAQVARTRSRPLPSGQISVPRAVIWMLLQAVLALAILLTFPPFAVFLGFASLVLVLLYPFAKRFTWWPQLFLGLAYSWGALLGWAAVTGTLHWPALALYGAGIAWTLFYDTIYAHQDKSDDARIGVLSTARRLGPATHLWLRWFMMVAVLLMAIAVGGALINDASPLKLVVALGAPWAFGWHLAWQNRTLDIDNSATCLRLFRANRDAGLIAALFIAISIFL